MPDPDPRSVRPLRVVQPAAPLPGSDAPIGLPGPPIPPQPRRARAKEWGEHALLHVAIQIGAGVLGVLAILGGAFLASAVGDADPAHRGWWQFAAFGLIGVVFELALAAVLLRHLGKQRRRLARAIPTRASIIRGARTAGKGVSTEEAKAIVRYQLADGHTLESSPFAIGGGRWPQGAVVDMSYDPAEPTWVIADGALERTYRFAVIFLGVSAAVPLSILVYSLLQIA